MSTPKEMHFNIKRTAAYCMTHGWHVDINRDIPYVSVEGPDEDQDHFFQGDEAVDLLKEAERGADQFDVYPHEFIIWSAQGW